MTGLFGWMKAWGLGLFLTTVALDALPDFLSDFHSGWTGRNVKALSEIDHVQHFFTLLIVSLVLGLAFYRLAVHRQEAEHQRDLANKAAQSALRGKLAPHFIFNSLNTLHAQIEADPRGAQATTERLAQLFRQVIEAADRVTIPLKQELAFVEAYLGIEQARLGDRLRVSIQVPEELESATVPPLSLQVLVENAIKHGVAPLEQGGEVRIGAEWKEGALHLWVEDPGPGFSNHRGTGTALDTLRQRLERPEDLEMGMVDGCHRVGFRWRQA
jgi:LytS/YehU family sensor histidine kinase